MKRTVVAAIIGVVVGALVLVGHSAVSSGASLGFGQDEAQCVPLRGQAPSSCEVGITDRLFGFWGLALGTFSAVIAFGLVAWLLPGRDAHRVGPAGRWIVAAALYAIGAGTIYWIVLWRMPPFTLEGWWLYTLAAFALLGAFLITRRRRADRATP